MREKEISSHTVLPSHPARRTAATVAALVLFVALAAAVGAARQPPQRPGIAGEIAAQQQQKPPSIADEIKGGSKSEPKGGNKAEPKGGQRNPGGRQEGDSAAGRGGGRGGRGGRGGGGVTLLPVTIVTGLADAEVFLNRDAVTRQRLGKTGADGKLLVKLPRGTHSVTASRAGSRVVRQQIDVQPGRTTFAFDLTGQGLQPNGVPVAATVTAEEVFDRFLDPKRADGVTLGDWQIAQAQTAAVYAQNPHDPYNVAQALFAQGQVAYLRRDYATALVSFNNAALTLPTSALTFYGLGNAYFATGQLGEALRGYQQAIKLNPTLALAYKGMGDVLAKQGKDKEALDYYGRARGLGYAPPAMELSMARSLLKQRRWQQAQALLFEIAATRPSAEVFVGLGDSYVGVKQPVSAVGAYRKAVQHDPKSALAHYKYGELSYQLREYAAALESLERALALDPSGAQFNRERARQMADGAAEKLSRRK